MTKAQKRGLLIIAIWAGFFLYLQSTMLMTNEKIRSRQRDIDYLMNQNKRMEIELFKCTSLEHIDQEAERLGMVRPSKVAFVVRSRVAQ